ncbi:hypothetical protein HF521_006911 [Silurus meridionalis]|uniref:PiggyBac transposable element-derived protein domain-containing protein n=1 Tax=Silurus meridionalis TaxID=175797 RepID=A0A8T0AS82_SILME|nr:hypothetical protein HF521_006911 [Silurus meridionalis]
MSWKDKTDNDTVPQTLRFLPAREPGPQLRSSDSHSPFSLFKMFFPDSVVSTLWHNTNAQAAKSIAKGRKYKWRDVTVSEMYRYIGLLFNMAMVKLPSIIDYWQQSRIFTVPFPATIMSRDRYRTISWNVRMSHPDADKENDRKRGTSEHDRLFRVKLLMDTIRPKAEEAFVTKAPIFIFPDPAQQFVAEVDASNIERYCLGPWTPILSLVLESSATFWASRPTFHLDSTSGRMDKLTGSTRLWKLVSSSSDKPILIEYDHNPLPTAATGLSLFQVVHGYLPPTFSNQEPRCTIPSGTLFFRPGRHGWRTAQASLFKNTIRLCQGGNHKRHLASHYASSAHSPFPKSSFK